eukprot:TRINITY_DN5111_c0_g1_i7.p1 TRINITY_DN5111_c0_g1~~TRINITY_DN5111_c0_g1_i7.p1  ORF type:complete len:643 (-),score=197.28 TRINITY_DN5111_c0_g1_i7:213-2141(-)
MMSYHLLNVAVVAVPLFILCIDADAKETDLDDFSLEDALGVELDQEMNCSLMGDGSTCKHSSALLQTYASIHPHQAVDTGPDVAESLQTTDESAVSFFQMDAAIEAVPGSKDSADPAGNRTQPSKEKKLSKEAEISVSVVPPATAAATTTASNNKQQQQTTSYSNSKQQQATTTNAATATATSTAAATNAEKSTAAASAATGNKDQQQQQQQPQQQPQQQQQQQLLQLEREKRQQEQQKGQEQWEWQKYVEEEDSKKKKLTSEAAAERKQEDEQLGEAVEKLLAHPALIIAAWLAVPLLGALFGLAMAASFYGRAGRSGGNRNIVYDFYEALMRRFFRPWEDPIDLLEAGECRSHELGEEASSPDYDRKSRLEHLICSEHCTAANLDNLLPKDVGYDLAFSKPKTSKKPVRITATVVGPASEGNVLTSPLTQQKCLRYEAAATQLCRSGPKDATREQAGVAFVVAFADAPDVHVEVQGNDAELLEMQEGSCMARQPYAVAPKHWKEFANSKQIQTSLTQSGKQPSASSLEGAMCEFQESVLLVGSQVTLVGELLRDSSGNLSLLPWQFGGSEVRKEAWRTSWELPASSSPSDSATGVHLPKVLISDNISFWRWPSSEEQSQDKVEADSSNIAEALVAAVEAV